MAITNLKGTTWKIDCSTITIDLSGFFSLDGTLTAGGYSATSVSGEGQFILRNGWSLTFPSESTEPYFYCNVSTDPYLLYKQDDSTSFDVDTNCTLYISGGADVTNADLIAWLSENGKLQEETKPTKVFTRLYIGDTVASAGSKCFKRLTTEEPQIAIPAGLYDADDNLIASWDTLVNTYGMDCEKTYTNTTYNTDTASPYYVLTKNDALASGTRLIIGDSVTKIGQYAFYNCTRLTSIVIPDSITAFLAVAFLGCSNLKNVYYTGTIEKWCGLVVGTYSASPMCNGANLYINGKLVTDLVIPDSVTVIDHFAFFGCTSLTSVAIPSGVTSIEYQAFMDCMALTSIVIPKSVTAIKQNAFGNCTSITEVYYNGDIEDWCNILFVAAASTPTYYGANLYINGELVTNLVIPDTLTAFKGYYTFRGCTSLISVVLPNGITSVASYSFENCTNLQSVVIPASVTNIWSAFAGCSALTDVYYAGTEEQWAQLTSGELGTSPLKSATIHYNYVPS